MKCSDCGSDINPFDGWTEVIRRQTVGPGSYNPEHPVALVTVSAAVLCWSCDEVEQ